IRRLKPFDHSVAMLLRRRAVEEESLASERFLQMLLNYRAHLGELREDQRAVAFGESLFQHFGQPRQLARTARYRGVVAEELSRMVANLFELGQSRQHLTSALDAFALAD